VAEAVAEAAAGADDAAALPVLELAAEQPAVSRATAASAAAGRKVRVNEVMRHHP